MNRQDVARQIQVEHELLRHLMEGLRITAGWQVQGPNAARKLSTLQFVVQSFQRHLERLLTLEEHDGYLDLVVACTPWLGRAADGLRAEHDRFRAEARQLVQRLERLTATDASGLDKVCADLLLLLKKIDEHNRKEAALLQEALERDEGGEG
jgi:hemerythrin-like domain-containing protein